ncbi:hypothetical protein HF1_08280 [Mycoplasma haemofelis str. Langford 1]|uniref:Uncharacterized protein n=2 Tax=Mycoplasma haemofelis TaxID=29501 RepID=F6FIW8_MYCHI|nr:hypothetical protein [Mycoplasma haemofelis]AEG73166.1 hypothetical protein MHF_0908 [Mycoplasma haemofelis Ohio2]CBY92836.1 hypothetical protein HF1_08280 [Mycoplasma haemofelis str. Langford 1]
MLKYWAVGVPVATGVAGASVYFSRPTEGSIANKIRSSISGKDYLQLVEIVSIGLSLRIYIRISKERS